jgi:NitT/TauT family transport system permease protein
MTSTWKQIIWPIVFLLVVLTVWESAVRVFKINPILMPGPIEIATYGWANLAKLALAFWITGKAAITGLALSTVLGIVIGAIFSQSKIIRISCYPYAVFLQTVPIVAMAPLIITWFDYGFRSVVIVATVISIFPIITNTTIGLLQVEQDLVDLMRLYRASRWQILTKLRFPSAVTSIMTGIKTSSGLAVVGAIVGEYFAGFQAGQYGLGYYIFTFHSQLKTALLFASVLTSTALGLFLFVSLSLMERYLLSRWLTDSETIAD